MLHDIVRALYGEEASDVLAVKLAGLYSARRARFLDHAEETIREAEDLLGLQSPTFGLRMLPPPRRVLDRPEKFAEWSTPLSGIPGSGPMLGGLAAGIGDRDAVSGLGTGFGSLLGQSAGGALGGMVGPHAGRALAKYLGESKQDGEQWGRTLGTMGGMALGGALGGYAGRRQTRPQPMNEQPQSGERRAEYRLAGAGQYLVPGLMAGAGGLMGMLSGDGSMDNPNVGRGLAGAAIGGGLGALTHGAASNLAAASRMRGAVGQAAEHVSPFSHEMSEYMRHTSGPNAGPRLPPDLEASVLQSMMNRTGSYKLAGGLPPGLAGRLTGGAVGAGLGGVIGYNAQDPKLLDPLLNPHLRRNNAIAGALLGGGLGALHGGGGGGGGGGARGPHPVEHVDMVPFVPAQLTAGGSRMASMKQAMGPLGTLLSRAAAPAAIGALGAYAASPQDPESEMRNSLTGAGIGGGLGLIHALHRSFSANPQLAAELMHSL